ncbi:Protein C8orf37 [Merluccius polli]|uniref:Cilia- and flagella-associated protein 418 n=1 Tax=Merluccius polli TaxID=89951 RepID=A0AA47MIV3_MERPO|nr:Protein C8orf37 [Merluccius polli]
MATVAIKEKVGHGVILRKGLNEHLTPLQKEVGATDVCSVQVADSKLSQDTVAVREPEDMDALLEELLDEDYDGSPGVQTEQIPTGSKVEGKSFTQSEERKCRPVFLGGTSVPCGVGSLVSQRSCDQLRCTSCDFRVLMFEDQEWDTSCDYLFLRNNMPDVERLRGKLRRSRGRRAYACQCSWFSARDLADLSQQPQLRWCFCKYTKRQSCSRSTRAASGGICKASFCKTLFAQTFCGRSKVIQLAT